MTYRNARSFFENHFFFHIDMEKASCIARESFETVPIMPDTEIEATLKSLGSGSCSTFSMRRLVNIAGFEVDRSFASHRFQHESSRGNFCQSNVA
jgi:hypothetical protein